MTHEQNDKNHKLLLLLVLFLIYQAPSDYKELYSIIALTVKTDLSEPDIYNLRVRIRINEASQEAELKDSYSPICLVDSLKIVVVLAAVFILSLSLIDAVNAC